ncbi:related to Altered inheritance of mitochondria protein 24, mitochondrial [Ramularia collo-cygni]|uniref:Altered inheritance of mitochondria protein 24, mitochondrial n=1 Tax=Ramularia collo-cygni TaxID=112498 RepID=A0A2D3USF2_9PEZI|nr:related to Altered inheritance of mitochondria protein 24, mitochondrial [Ramularia collo-cygni]CZT14567.1 related to Altered inheritance of mitochondria protein 24, mitochondrial [Ramularia collo-cygni]
MRAVRRLRPTNAVRSIGNRRFVQISSVPSSSEPQQSLEPRASSGSPTAADARFEILGSPFSLLSASISASQDLYTRKGTLAGFNGKAENAVSTLSVLEPFRRLPLGIPFLYQRITSTTPYSALIATKSPITSLVVVHLDGRLDWMVAQRNALLAWTGHTLSLKPRWNMKMSLAHWGSTLVTGRGLLALSGKGLIHQITLKTGEEYVVRPSNVIAYSMMQHAPQPYRFKSSNMRLQIPNPLTWLPDTRFWRTMRESAVWRFTRDATFTLRTWARRTIWGDRLFLHFHGPATILVQSRSAAIADVLTSEDVNEIADSPAGAVPRALAVTSPAEAGAEPGMPKALPTKMSYASVTKDGDVAFERQEAVKA